MNQSEKILSKAEDLFLNCGIRSITMDDLATDLGMSKKTLYATVPNKAALVEKTLQQHLEKEKTILKEIRANSENAIDEMFKIGRHFTTHLRSLHPSALYDLQKYYPKAWNIYLTYRNEFLYNQIYENMIMGIKQGVYHKTIKPDIIATIYIARSDLLVDQKMFSFSKHSMLDVFVEYLKYHIRGIASENGRVLLDKLKID